MRAMAKTTRAAAALAFVLIATSSTVLSAQTDLTGAWVMTLEFPQGQVAGEAHFKQTGDKISVEVVTPSSKLDFSGTLVSNKIAADYSSPLKGSALEMKLMGVVDGERLSGTIDLGGGLQVKWTAVRKPATGAPTPHEAGDATGSPPSK